MSLLSTQEVGLYDYWPINISRLFPTTLLQRIPMEMHYDVILQQYKRGSVFELGALLTGLSLHKHCGEQ